MRNLPVNILLALVLILSLLSCDRTPHGVLSTNAMANLIVDLELANAYIDNHISEFTTDSSKLVLKQSIFRKHGITQDDYDSSLVWYAHNMEEYTKAYDKAVAKLQHRYDKVARGKGAAGGLGNGIQGSIAAEPADMHTGDPSAQGQPIKKDNLRKLSRKPISTDAGGDSADLWQGRRCYLLTQGVKHGFIPFDILPDRNKQPGDRYQLSYKLMRGGNQFKVSLNIDYTDGTTTQIARGTNSDGWVSVDVQSDTTRHVRRVYGYVSYDIKRGQVAYVDSLMLMRTHLNTNNYGYIHAQRHYERPKR